MSNGGVNAVSLYGDSVSTIGNSIWDPAWGPPRTVLAMNLPLRFFHEGARVFGDLQHTACATILRCLGWIATESGLGTEYKVGGVNHAYYYSSCKPRTVQFWEELKSGVDDGVAGYRLWFCILDPSLDIHDGFRKLIQKNTEELEERRQFAASRIRSQTKNSSFSENAFQEAAGTITGNMHHPLEKDIMSDVSLATRVFGMYIGTHKSGGDRELSEDILRDPSPFDPTTVLGVDHAFTLHMEGVRGDQCDCDNYNVGDGGLADFAGHFPEGVRVTRTMTQNFAMNFLAGLPLPHISRTFCKVPHDRFMRYQAEVEQAMRRLNDAEASGAINGAQRKCLLEDIGQARARMARAADAMEDEFRAIRMTAPSQTSTAVGDGEGENVDYEECAKNLNDLRRLYDKNSVRVRDMRAQFSEASRAKEAYDDSPTLVDEKTFPDAMRNLRVDMLDQMDMVEKNSTRLFAVERNMSKWMAARTHRGGGAAHWTRHFGRARNLSPFGNMILRMNTEFADVHEVDSNFQLVHTANLVVLSVFHYKFDLRPNLVISGKPSTGKSYAIGVVKKITVPGIITEFAHQTAQAFNTSKGMKGACLYTDETPTEEFGIDKYGNHVPGNIFLKGVTANQHSTTLSIESRDTGSSREQVMYFALWMVGMIKVSLSFLPHSPPFFANTTKCTNDELPPSGTPVMDRFIHFPMRERKPTAGSGSGKSRMCSLNLSGEGAIADRMRSSIDGAQLQCYYVYKWNEAIESGALPEIDTENAKIIINWIFEELAKHDVPMPRLRPVKILISLCRTLTMYYGVDMEYFSEEALAKRALAFGAPPHPPPPYAPVDEHLAYDKAVQEAFRKAETEPFGPHMLDGLVKWGVVTQEIVVFVITLLDYVWVPSIETEVSRAAAGIAGGAENPDGTWRPVRGVTSMRRDFTVLDGQGMGMGMGMGAPPPTPVPVPVPASAPAEDDDDVVMPADASADASAAADAAPRRDFYDNNYVEILGPNAVAISERIVRGMERPPSENDVKSALDTMCGKYIKAKPKIWTRVPGGFLTEDPNTGAVTVIFRNVLSHVVAEMSFPNVDAALKWQREYSAFHKMDVDALVDNPLCMERDAKEIPMVIIDTLNDRQAASCHRKRICIAVDIINRTYDTLLIDCIQKALAHRFQREAEFMTALPKKHVVRSIDLPHDVPVTLHGVFQTIKIKPDYAVIKTVDNDYARTQNEVDTLLNISGANLTEEEETRVRASQAPVYSLMDNIDDVGAHRYWRTHGVISTEVGAAYAPVAHKIMDRTRKNFPSIFGLVDERMVETYPQDWIKRIDEARLLASKGKAPTWGWDVGNEEFYTDKSNINNASRERQVHLQPIARKSRPPPLKGPDEDSDDDADIAAAAAEEAEVPHPHNANEAYGVGEGVGVGVGDGVIPHDDDDDDGYDSDWLSVRFAQGSADPLPGLASGLDLGDDDDDEEEGGSASLGKRVASHAQLGAGSSADVSEEQIEAHIRRAAGGMERLQKMARY